MRTPWWDGDNAITTEGSSPDGPADACFDGTENDVWYIYTAQCDGMVSVNFCSDGGAVDSKIAVYGEIVCPVGEAIACNDNDGPGCGGLGASVSFAAVSGASYQIRIAIAEAGSHLLSIACVPGNGCPQDFNQDGSTDPDDLGDYINCYFAQPPCDRADYNADGSIDPDDLGDYINVYFGPAC